MLLLWSDGLDGVAGVYSTFTPISLFFFFKNKNKNEKKSVNPVKCRESLVSH
jgi:hypothetical protein